MGRLLSQHDLLLQVTPFDVIACDVTHQRNAGRAQIRFARLDDVTCGFGRPAGAAEQIDLPRRVEDRLVLMDADTLVAEQDLARILVAAGQIHLWILIGGYRLVIGAGFGDAGRRHLHIRIFGPAPV